jgi:hypothetical protein
MPPIRDEDDDDDDNDDNSMPFQIDDDHDFVPLPQEKSKPIMFGDDDEATSELKTFMSDLSKFDKKVGYTPDLLEDVRSFGLVVPTRFIALTSLLFDRPH